MLFTHVAVGKSTKDICREFWNWMLAATLNI
nr:MAG TPA: Immunity protein Imm5 [Caudoviricetes sp.]